MHLRFSTIRATSILISLRCLGGARLQDEALLILRDRVADIIFGTLFLFGGLAACCIAAMRRGSSVRILIWLGVWSAMYGRNPCAIPAVLALLLMVPRHLPFVSCQRVSYLGCWLTRLELSLGMLRVWLKAVISVGLAMGLAVLASSSLPVRTRSRCPQPSSPPAPSRTGAVVAVHDYQHFSFTPSQSNHVLAVARCFCPGSVVYQPGAPWVTRLLIYWTLWLQFSYFRLGMCRRPSLQATPIAVD